MTTIHGKTYGTGKRKNAIARVFMALQQQVRRIRSRCLELLDEFHGRLLVPFQRTHSHNGSGDRVAHMQHRARAFEQFG
jgi:ribosomal protein S9